ASGILLQQLRQGAPVDVFASADQVTMDQAHEQDLIDSATRRDFVRNTLVVIVPRMAADTAVSASDLMALTQDGFQRIGLGKPDTVPAGRYSQQALQAANLWSTLAARFIYADSVRQVLDYVRRGEVDAGFVYGSDAL